MRRLRTLLTGGALVIGAASFALTGTPKVATAAGGLDVYNVKGNAAAIEIAVRNPYSFVVAPDSQLPRATASIEAGQVSALASPADPGDSVDALAGLVVPQGEAGITSGLTDPQCGGGKAPEPFRSVFATAASVVPVIAQSNPYATTPYEHTSATYPNAKSPGRQQSAFFGTDPSVADPTGAVAVQGAAGKVVADKDLGVADAGAAAALTVAPLNLAIGRVSSHVELHGQGSKATSDATSMLSNIDINPPGITLPPAPKPAPGLPGSAGPPASAQPVLHIGSLVSTVHTERAASASRATSSHNLQIGGVAVLGQPATIDDSGVHLIGQNQSLQPVVDQLNKLFTAVNGLPTVAGQHIVPQGSMAGPIVTDTVSHNGNQASSSLSGLTLSLTNTILVPSQTQGLTQTCGKPPPPPTLVPASVTYTVTLATAQSSAYGYSFPPLPPLDLSGASAASSGSTLGSSLPPLSSDLGAITTSPGSNGSGGGAAHGARRHTLTARPASSVVDMAMLSKPALLTLATLAELLILGALIACYRLPPARAPRESAIADMDLA